MNKFIPLYCWFLCLLILTGFSIFSTKPKHIIIWTKDSQLQWTDFQARSKNSETSAISFVYIEKKKIITDSNKVKITITAVFNGSKSWYNKEYQTDRVLKHEQGHFDIAEISARKIRKKLHKASKNGITLINLENIWLDGYKDYEKMQKEYDLQTNFHRNNDSQIEWNEKIQNELNELSEFSGQDLLLLLDCQK